jgi:hypothetical protein
MCIGKRVAKTHDLPYTHHQIAQLLSKADDRRRVCILLMCSGGLRRGGITACSKKYIQEEMSKPIEKRNFHCLKIGDLKKIEKYNLYQVQVYSYSPDDTYTTFITPEASSAVDFYLQYRKNHGEVLRDTAPLLRNQFDKRFAKSIANIKPITDIGLDTLIYSLIYDAGLLKAFQVYQVSDEN